MSTTSAYKPLFIGSPQTSKAPYRQEEWLLRANWIGTTKIYFSWVLDELSIRLVYNASCNICKKAGFSIKMTRLVIRNILLLQFIHNVLHNFIQTFTAHFPTKKILLHNYVYCTISSNPPNTWLSNKLHILINFHLSFIYKQISLPARIALCGSTARHCEKWITRINLNIGPMLCRLKKPLLSYLIIVISLCFEELIDS